MGREGNTLIIRDFPWICDRDGDENYWYEYICIYMHIYWKSDHKECKQKIFGMI